MSKFANRFASADPEKREHLLNLPRHLTECADRQILNTLLTDLHFIQAKCAAGMVMDLQGDYERATTLWPEGRKEVAKVIQYREALSEYIHDLVGSAADARSQGRTVNNAKRGVSARSTGAKLPVPPLSIARWRRKRPRSSTGGMAKRADSYEGVKVFHRFVRAQAHALGTFGSYPNFCAEQAYNSNLPEVLAARAERVLDEVDEPYAGIRRPSEGSTGSVIQLYRTLRTEEISVRCLAMTPDAKYLVSGGEAQVLSLWELDTGECVARLSGHPDRIFCAAISADGRVAVSGDFDGWLCFWDLHKRRLLKLLRAHEGPVFSVSLTPDGRTAFSGGTDKVLRVWSMETGECVRVLEHEHLEEVKAIRTNSNARYLVSGHSWDGEDNEALSILLNVWELESGVLVRRLWQHAGVSCLDMTPDGKRIVSGDWDGRISFWDPEKEKPLSRVTIEEKVESLAFAHDGRTLISLDSDGMVSVWDVKSGDHILSFDALHFGSGGSVVASADCSCAVTSSANDGVVKVWALDGHRGRIRIKGHKHEVYNVFMDTKRKRIISRGRDQSLCVWDLDSLGAIDKVDADVGLLSGLSIDVWSGLVVLANGKKGLFLWDYASDEGLCCLNVEDGSWYTASRVTPDGNRASKRGGTVEVWCPKTHRRLASYQRNLHSACGADISIDGRFAQVAAGSIWRILDLASGQILGSNLNLPISASSPDGRIAFSTDVSGELHVYDLKTMTRVKILSADSKGFDKVEFGPTGQKIAFEQSTFGASTLHFWSWTDDVLLQSSDEHDGPVTGLAFTPDGLHVVSTSTDKTLRVWEVKTGRCCCICYDPAGFRCISSIQPDGTLTIGTELGTVSVVELRHLPREAPFVTAVRLWRYGNDKYQGQWDDNLTVLCPWCGCRIPVDTKVAGAISDTMEAFGLSPSDVPCLCLPTDAWQEKRLLTECTACRQQIRYNPFVVDNREGYLADSLQGHPTKGDNSVASSAMIVPCCKICGKRTTDLRIYLHDGGAVHAECLVDGDSPQESPTFVDEKSTEKCICCGHESECGAVKTPIGWVCLTCYQGSFEMISNSVELTTLSGADLVAAISGNAKLRDRLTVLWRRAEVIRRLKNSSTDGYENFKMRLVENLGYVEKNPLASEVRQLALNSCIDVGEEMLPLLLDMCRQEPWQFYANTLVALGSIAPEDARFRQMLKIASEDPRPEIRLRVPMAVDHHETEWTRQLVEGMVFDSAQEVSDLAFDVVDGWDIAAGTMKKEDKKFRSFVLPLVTNPDAAIRQCVPRSLLEYRATWARKLAEKMAEDPDENVRAEVQKLMAAWEGQGE